MTGLRGRIILGAMSPEAQKLVSALPARIWQRIDLDGNGCWKWHGALDRDGYGISTPFGGHASRGVHRLVFAAVVGPIPTGHDVDHICWVRDCVNPSHLRTLPALENRGLQRRILIRHDQKIAAHKYRNSACRRGHSMSGPNLRITVDGYARCRACQARNSRDSKKRTRNAAKE